MSTTYSMQLMQTPTLPQYIPSKAAQSFILTTTVGLLSNTFQVALVLGAVAATATLAEAVTRPLMKQIFPDAPFLVVAFQYSLSHFGAVYLTGNYIAPSLGIAEINLSNIFFRVLGFAYFNLYESRNGEDLLSCWDINRAMTTIL